MELDRQVPPDLGGERILALAGPPGQVQGQLTLRNPGEMPLVLDGTRVRALPGTPAGPAGAQGGPVWSPGRVELRPGEVRRLPVLLTFDPRTPPGEYPAELELAGERRPVRVYVAEHREVAIHPARLTLDNRPGTRVKKSVVLTNHGNVAESLPEIGAVFLDPELARSQAMRGALDEVGAELSSQDDLAAALGRQYKAIYDGLTLSVHNPEVTLEPGEVRPLDLEIELPMTLSPRSRYTGLAPILTSTLYFAIVPS